MVAIWSGVLVGKIGRSGVGVNYHGAYPDYFKDVERA